MPIPVPCFQRLLKIEGDIAAIETALEQLKAAGKSVWL
jgi:DNA-binding FrmR family transcriptional regulator